MKNWIKRSLTLVMSVILIAGLMCTGVSAADMSVKVELDGKAVTFTDAEPQVLDGRTYVPFRAVFEALGAEVGFDEAERTVSAKRNGTTVIIPIDSHEITVITGGIVYTDYMDATAYVSESGRTYIPVRYAAEALGCCVGWDADDRTVILVDTQSMVNQAMEKNEFTLLARYTDYADKFNQGNYEMKLDMDMAATVLAYKVMTVDCSATGIIAGGSAGEMSMTMKLDMAGLLDLMAKVLDSEAEKEELKAAFAEAGMTDMKMEVTVQVRMDMDEGKMYMNMSGVPGMEAVLPADTWLFIDIDELFAELDGYGVSLLDMDYSGFGPQDFIVPMINGMSYIYDKDSAYNDIKTQVDEFVAIFSDSAFVKNGRSYTNTQKIEELGGLTVSFRLDTNDAGDVVGYEMSADMALTLEEMGLDEYDFAEIAEMGKQLGVTLKPEDLKLSFRSGMDGQNKETLDMEISMGNLVLLTIDAEGTYTPTTKLPNTGLPVGAKSIGLEQWLMSQY